jgi:hypothetical protein
MGHAIVGRQDIIGKLMATRMVMRANISEDMAERKGYFSISAVSASVVGQFLLIAKASTV